MLPKTGSTITGSARAGRLEAELAREAAEGDVRVERETQALGAVGRELEARLEPRELARGPRAPAFPSAGRAG
jgi:hypothetical protein